MSAGLPFLSALGTLNHILAAELLWYGRMTSTTVIGDGKWNIPTLAPLWSSPASCKLFLWCPVRFLPQWASCDLIFDCVFVCPSAWQHLTTSLDEVNTELITQQARWSALLQRLQPAQVSSTFSYVTTDGQHASQVYGLALHHVINHATHHRCVFNSCVHLCELGCARALPPLREYCLQLLLCVRVQRSNQCDFNSECTACACVRRARLPGLQDLINCVQCIV